MVIESGILYLGFDHTWVKFRKSVHLYVYFYPLHKCITVNLSFAWFYKLCMYVCMYVNDPVNKASFVFNLENKKQKEHL